MHVIYVGSCARKFGSSGSKSALASCRFGRSSRGFEGGGVVVATYLFADTPHSRRSSKHEVCIEKVPPCGTEALRQALYTTITRKDKVSRPPMAIIHQADTS